MTQKPIQKTNSLSTYILSVLGNVLLGILGIQNVLEVIPVRTGDKRFNQ